MANYMQDTQADDIGIKAVFNKDDIDTQKLWQIDQAKQSYLMSLSDLDVKTAGAQLTDFLSTQLSLMAKYFNREEIEKEKVDVGILGKQTFYQLKALSETNYDDDIDSIRLIAEKAFEIYDHFARIIGNELPMGKTDFLGK